jgi:hypothetical protein
MSTRNLPGDKGRLVRKADNLAGISKPTDQNMWETRRLTALWASAPFYRDSFTAFNYILLLSKPHVSLLVWKPINLNQKNVVLAFADED